MNKISGKTAGKKKQINIRLTDEELKMLKEKSREYSSMSALIIDAVQEFNNKSGRNRVDTMIEFARYAKQIEVEMARVGNNLNQITHELNLIKYKRGTPPSPEVLLGAIKESMDINNLVLKEIRKLSNKHRKI